MLIDVKCIANAITCKAKKSADKLKKCFEIVASHYYPSMTYSQNIKKNFFRERFML